MNELTKFLVEGILDETTEKVVALFGGGFKPPTKGHLDVVNNGIKQNPEVTEVKILVGGKERDGFTQDQAVKIWNLYNDIGFIDKPATIIPVSSPFSYYKEYLKNNPSSVESIRGPILEQKIIDNITSMAKISKKSMKVCP